MPLVLLLNRSGKKVEKVRDYSRFQQFGMEFGHAINRMASNDGQIGHADMRVRPLLENRNPPEAVHIPGITCGYFPQESRVDLLDDLEMTWKKPPE